MRLIIIIALLAAGQAWAESLNLVGLVTNDAGYVLRIEDTNVAITSDVANAANLAKWVGEEVQLQAQGTIVDSDGVRIITLSAINSVVLSTEE